MSRSAIGRCRACNARVAWCRTANGKRMPLDAAPVEAGDFVALRQGEGDYLAVKFQALAHVGEKRFTSHFATCPARKRPAASPANAKNRKSTATTADDATHQERQRSLL
jgi:hypothetical protein